MVGLFVTHVIIEELRPCLEAAIEEHFEVLKGHLGEGEGGRE